MGKVSPFKGKHHSEESKAIMSLKASLRRGSKAGNWKGGIRYNDGYRYFYYPAHPNATKKGYVAEHRLVMEKVLGRLLDPKEIIHHVDENKLNNAPSNLKIFPSKGKHSVKEHCKRDSLGRFS